jgi:hypothetical protein
MESSKLALVVLGSHRSGTSAMTHVMALSGFALPKTMLPPQADNPAGFWESSIIVALNDEILAMRDTSWHDVFPPDDAPLLSNSGAVCLAKAEAAIGSEFEGATPIAFKDPRVSILVEFWKHALERQGYESAFLVMVRNPVEVAASLAKRNGFSHERGLLLWLTNMLAAERKSRGSRRLFVCYERLLEDVFGILDDVESMIGEPLPRRTRVAELEVQRAINGELRHHRATAEIKVRGELERLASDVYCWLSASAKGEAPNAGVLDRAAASLGVCEELVGGVIAELRGEPEKLGLALQAEHMRGEGLKRDLEVAADEVNTLTQTSEILKHELSVASDEIIKLAKKSEGLERDLGTAFAEVNTLKQTVEDQEAHLSHSRATLELEKSSLTLMSKDLAVAQSEAAIRSKKIEALEALHLELQAQANEWASERTELAEQDRVQRQQIAYLNDRAETLSEAIIYIQSRIWWRAFSRLKRLIT